MGLSTEINGKNGLQQSMF